jgi:ABC-type glycerol-3-phosphate transport system permease component
MASTSLGRASARERAVGLALVAPAFLVVVGLLIYPVAYDVWLSVTEAQATQWSTAFVGSRHYRQLLGDPVFWQAARNTVALVVATATVELVVGVLTALLLWWRFWGRAFVFVSVFIPWAFPATFSAFAWYWLLMPPFPAFYVGPVLDLRWGLESLFGPGAWQVLSLAVMNVWRGSSIIAIFLLAGFNAIPEELTDYAKLEARNAWQYFWRVVAPFSRRFLVLAALVALVITYVEYASMYVETGGRITVPVLGTMAYREAIQNGNLALGAALSLVPLPVAIALVLVCLRLLERSPALPVRVTGDTRPPRTREPGRCRDIMTSRASDSGPRPGLRRRALIVAGIAAAVAVTVFHLFPVYYTAVQAFRSVPEYALGNPFWAYQPTLEDVQEVIASPLIWRWAWNTFVIFGVVLIVGLGVSLLAGYAVARLAVPGGRWIVRLMFFGYFVPQTAVVIPVFQVFLAWGLDDTLVGIVLLYLTIAVPFATWLFYMYFQGLSPEIEEHALLDGSRTQVFLGIVLPMSTPVVVAAGLFAVGMMGADVLYTGIFSLSHSTKTLPAGLGLTAVGLDEWASANAAILLSSVPIMVVCAGLSPSYVRGLRAALIEGA